MPCQNRPLCSACYSSLPFPGCMHGGILRLLSPQGTSPNSFSVNFHPLPNSDKPFLSPSPQWRICPRSLCPPLISFFDCSLSADSMQRMQIRALLFLSESDLKWGHTCTHLQRGHGNMHILQSVDLHALSDTQPLTRRILAFLKWADRNICLTGATDYFIYMHIHAVYSDKWRAE